MMDVCARRHIAPRAAVLPLMAGLAAGFLYWHGRIGAVHLLIALGLGAVIAVIVVIDYVYEIVPDQLSLSTLAAGLLVNGVVFDERLAVDWEYPLGALLGGASFWIIRAGYSALRQVEGLGLGDVKLAAACGAWVGLQGLPAVLLLAAAGGLIWIAAASWWRGVAVATTDRVPFGAFLAPALWVVWLVSL
jgi:leader peptidase (prepilin peptidase) / N-methyltransferase